MTQVLGRALVKSGHAVRVAGIHPNGYPAPDYEEDEGVRVWRLREPSGRFGWLRARYRLYRLISGWAKDGEIDLLESPDSNGWIAGWPRLPIPAILRSNGSHSYFRHEMGAAVNWVDFNLEKWSYGRSDAWAAVSSYTAGETARLFSLPSGPRTILYNPVSSLANAAGIETRDRNLVVFTGTLTAKKGIVSLIDAWPEVVERWPAAVLEVFGKDAGAPGGGSMPSHLQSRLPAHLASSVVFRGHVGRAELFSALSRTRVAVFPSYSEAFAIAPLEAMALGAPTISSRRGSGPELIADERDGLLVDPAEPSGIANAIVRVLQDDELAARLGRAGHERVRDAFSLEHLIPQNERFYTSVVESFRRRGTAA